MVGLPAIAVLDWIPLVGRASREDVSRSPGISRARPDQPDPDTADARRGISSDLVFQEETTRLLITRDKEGLSTSESQAPPRCAVWPRARLHRDANNGKELGWQYSRNGSSEFRDDSTAGASGEVDLGSSAFSPDEF